MYSTDKEVKLLDRRLGILYVSIFSLVSVYVVGVRLVVERGYEAKELSMGIVGAQLQGRTFTLTGGVASPMDEASLTMPQPEGDALFIPTRVLTTPNQALDNCTDPDHSCSQDADCPRDPPLAYGLCERGKCARQQWCPAAAASPLANGGGGETVSTLQALDRLFI